MENKRFEIGKAYEHTCGSQLYICGMADTVLHGICFIAEEGWNKNELLKRKIEFEEQKRNGSIPSDVKLADDKGWNILTPISMAIDASVNYHEITKEQFIKNNTAK